MNKSNLTNLLTIILLILGFTLENNILFTVALFAFSGAITNTLAIHMLFEKVPFLYGSGVIEQRFEKFKSTIHSLIMNQFFNPQNLKKFFEDEVNSVKNTIDFEKILNKTDFTPAFDSLKDAVLESPFGGMLGMFGGESALEPLKEPFSKKLQGSIIKISQTESFQKVLEEAIKSDSLNEDIHEKLSQIVNKRLDELTPKMVKNIVQEMIKEHLGWLVIWGAVFGGLIGLISTFI